MFTIELNVSYGTWSYRQQFSTYLNRGFVDYRHEYETEKEALEVFNTALEQANERLLDTYQIEYAELYIEKIDEHGERLKLVKHEQLIN